jgi:hypothetical protein
MRSSSFVIFSGANFFSGSGNTLLREGRSGSLAGLLRHNEENMLVYDNEENIRIFVYHFPRFNIQYYDALT